MEYSNGAFNHRFDRIEKDIEESRHELTAAIEKHSVVIGTLVSAITQLTGKLDVLASTHMKIIYWLLVLVSTAFLGTKALELYKIFAAV